MSTDHTLKIPLVSSETAHYTIGLTKKWDERPQFKVVKGISVLMKKGFVVIILIGLAFLVGRQSPTWFIKQKPVPVGTITAVPQGAEWIDLFDVEHASHWKNTLDDKDIFELEDGMLHIFGASKAKLRYVGYGEEDFENFELHVEAKLTPNANSGMFLRQQPGDEIYRGFEIQVQDDFGQAPNRNTSGSIYDVVTGMYNMAFPAGEWNSYDIKLNHHDVEVMMNGWLVIKADLSKMDTPLGKFKVAYRDIPLSGMLTFQDHGGEVWYRNLRIKRLPDSPKNDDDPKSESD